MEKAKLKQQIMERLKKGLEVLEGAALASHAEATHESSKAENKYDTRGLEAAYLAGGQARQAKEILDSIKTYDVLTIKDFAPEDPIDLTALVEVEANGATSFFFIGPKGGGLEINFRRKEITVITPQSPLGQDLTGKKAGTKWTSQVGGRAVKYRIVSVL